MGVLVGVGPNIHTRECKTHPPILLLIKISSSKTEIKKRPTNGISSNQFLSNIPYGINESSGLVCMRQFRLRYHWTKQLSRQPSCCTRTLNLPAAIITQPNNIIYDSIYQNNDNKTLASNFLSQLWVSKSGPHIFFSSFLLYPKS